MLLKRGKRSRYVDIEFMNDGMWLSYLRMAGRGYLLKVDERAGDYYYVSRYK